MQVVTKREIELLIPTVRLLGLTRGIQETLTFPDSLATNALIEFGASCFTSCVSSSYPSHTIAKFNACIFKGMVQVRGWVGCAPK